MELKEALERIKRYNKGISLRSCTPIEKAFVKEINEREDYFYGFSFALDLKTEHVESFIHSQKNFQGLLKEQGKKLCEYLRHIQDFSCNTGSIRMDVRSIDFRNYASRTMSAITAFYLFYGADLDWKALIYGEYRQLFYNIDFSSVIASEILANNTEIITYCTDVLLSENNTAVLTRDVILAIEKSRNEALWDLLGKLLVAASLQEGLRQSILESVDEYQLDCFMMFQEIILEHNLLRFSSVQRSVLTWIGIGYDSVKEKEVTLIFDMLYRFYRDDHLRKQALGRDPLQSYLALYTRGARQVESAIQEAHELLESKDRIQVASALVYLKLTMQFDCIAHREFLEYYAQDEWIIALYLSEFSKLNEIKATSAQAMYLFDHVEQFVCNMKATQNFSSKGFSWFQITLQKSVVCKVLFRLLLISKKVSHIERFLPYVSMSLYDKDMNTFMNELFPSMSDSAKKSFLLKEIISTNTTFQKMIEKMYLQMSLYDSDIILLEDRLKSKNAKARASIVSIIASQSPTIIKESYDRLIVSEQKTIRDCALELQQKSPHIFDTKSHNVIPIIGKDEGYGLYTPSSTYSYLGIQKISIIKKGLFRKESIDIQHLLPWKKQQIHEYLIKWSKRIQAMENLEYKTNFGYNQLKSGYIYPLDHSRYDIEALPFAKQWIAFIEEDDLKDNELFQLCFLLTTSHDEVDLASFLTGDSGLYTIRYSEVSNIAYISIIEKIFQYYYEGRKNGRKEFAITLWEMIIYYCRESSFFYKNYNEQNVRYALSSLQSMLFLSKSFDFVSCDEQDFKNYFPIYAQAYGKFNLECSADTYRKFNLEPLVLVRAMIHNFLSKEDVIEQILDTHEPKEVYYWGNNQQSQLFQAYSCAYFEGHGLYGKPIFSLDDYKSRASKDIIVRLRELLDEISNNLVGMETSRLNEETPVTSLVKQLRVVCGIDYLCTALSMVEQEELRRHENGDDRVGVFTDLIRHCYPIDNENRQALLMISEKRLVEVAMLAPQWISIMNTILQWDGFQDACYYFIAHMKSYDYQQKKAEIARYTDLEPEDLNDGAFDIDWCKRIYHQLGKKRFMIIYQAAKFLCENAFHTRARKFADACLELVDKESLLIQAKEKRNKDALNAYCIYPLKDDKDLLQRYLYIQQFIKEAKKFGSQRQASEKRAAQMALFNLARNSRFETVTRLSWMMESEMIAQYAHYLLPQKIQDVEVWIKIDEQGHNEICISKKGKQQKTIPNSLKKHETILEIKSIHTQWNEQYRRSREMLQQAMEERNIFGQEEITIMFQNPIVSPMLSKLVLISDEQLGFYQDGYLQGLTQRYPLGKQFRIAHTFDLYQHQVWSSYQKKLFKDEIVQPFKQVFRELYLKLEDEMNETNTKRYSGYQIQPKKVAATLKNRKWNVSYESGLERIYYKENLVVNLYADADWFSPSDIEAPSIDYVSFSSRQNYQGVHIKEIDDIVFSETMRDLDLAVSTAYVGGVDPTTSFSTIQLRNTIISYTCELMKLNNVVLQDHFANIKGVLNDYSVHLGSGVIHQSVGGALHVVPVFSSQRGRVYLPFLDEDPKTAEILSKIIMLAQDNKIKDPSILSQIVSNPSKPF